MPISNNQIHDTSVNQNSTSSQNALWTISEIFCYKLGFFLPSVQGPEVDEEPFLDGGYNSEHVKADLNDFPGGTISSGAVAKVWRNTSFISSSIV